MPSAIIEGVEQHDADGSRVVRAADEQRAGIVLQGLVARRERHLAVDDRWRRRWVEAMTREIDREGDDDDAEREDQVGGMNCGRRGEVLDHQYCTLRST